MTLPFTYLFHFLCYFGRFCPGMLTTCGAHRDNWKLCKMGRGGSGPEFHVNSRSGRVGSLHLWVGLGRVKKIGPTSNSAIQPITENIRLIVKERVSFRRLSVPTTIRYCRSVFEAHRTAQLMQNAFLNSVRPSVRTYGYHTRYLLKWLNISSRNFHCMVATILVFPCVGQAPLYLRT